VLAEAGVMAEHVDEVILVGGATRVPFLRRRVAEHFRREPRHDLNPMEVVAEGAALQAALLAAPEQLAAVAAPVLIDVTPHPLGLATAGGFTDVLIEKNEAIPAERTRVFTTARDGQREVVIRICQGAARSFAANDLLGELRLDGLRDGRRGDVKIEVTFLVDADGILQASARDAGTGRAAKVALRVVGGART
jgi:molecular chaperone DnaK